MRRWWILSFVLFGYDGVKGVLFAIVSRSMSEPLQSCTTSIKCITSIIHNKRRHVVSHIFRFDLTILSSHTMYTPGHTSSRD